MNQPQVSVLIVTFQNEQDIGDCLEALRQQEFTDFEVIVVDNHSADQTLLHIVPNDCLKVIPLTENRGFTGGNIEGLKAARGNYIALLNPDTKAAPMWLGQLVRAMNEHPEVGICASKLMRYGSAIIDSAGDGCTTSGKGFKWGDGEASERFDRQKYVFGACGGAVLIRRELIDEIGFLDDDFFLIYEDTDFCFRAQLTGWKCLFIPDALVYHKVSASISRYSDWGIYYAVRNSKFVIVKNMPFSLIIKYLYQSVIQDIGSFLFFGVKHKRLKVFIKAWLGYLIALPVLLKKRKRIQQMRKLKAREIENLLTSFWQPDFFCKKLDKMRYH